MISADLKQAILNLNEDDKRELIQIIWESESEENIDLSEKHLEILNKRYSLYKENKMEFRDWEDVKKDILDAKI